MDVQEREARLARAESEHSLQAQHLLAYRSLFVASVGALIALATALIVLNATRTCTIISATIGLISLVGAYVTARWVEVCEDRAAVVQYWRWRVLVLERGGHAAKDQLAQFLRIRHRRSLWEFSEFVHARWDIVRPTGISATYSRDSARIWFRKHLPYVVGLLWFAILVLSILTGIGALHCASPD